MGLYDEPRPGGSRSTSDEQVAALIHRILQPKPLEATQWSCRSLPAEIKCSKSTIHRVWRAFAFNFTVRSISNLRPLPFSWKKSRVLLVSICIHLLRLWFLGLMQKAQSLAWDRMQPLLPGSLR